MKIRRIAAAVLAVTSLVGGLTACGNSSSADSGTTVKVGVVGDSNEVWDQVVIPNLKKEGINVELVKFSDYIQPNEALAKGDIDLNAYQGYILMDDFNKTHDNALAAVGETVLNPISLYSDKAKKVEDIPEGSEVTIANDSVNAARGLLLLQSAGLIKLDYKEGTNPTPDDIAPAYRMGFHAARMFAKLGCSKISIPIPDKIAQKKNWMQDILTPSTRSVK